MTEDEEKVVLVYPSGYVKKTWWCDNNTHATCVKMTVPCTCKCHKEED